MRFRHIIVLLAGLLTCMGQAAAQDAVQIWRNAAGENHAAFHSWMVENGVGTTDAYSLEALGLLAYAYAEEQGHLDLVPASYRESGAYADLFLRWNGLEGLTMSVDEFRRRGSGIGFWLPIPGRPTTVQETQAADAPAVPENTGSVPTDSEAAAELAAVQSEVAALAGELSALQDTAVSADRFEELRGDLEAISGRIETLGANFGALSNALDGVADRLNNLESVPATEVGSISAELAEQLTLVENEVGDRLTSIEIQIESVEATATNAITISNDNAERIDTVATTAAAAADQAATATELAGSNEERIDTLTVRINDIGGVRNVIDEVQSGQDALDGRLTDLESANLVSRVTELEHGTAAVVPWDIGLVNSMFGEEHVISQWYEANLVWGRVILGVLCLALAVLFIWAVVRSATRKSRKQTRDLVSVVEHPETGLAAAHTKAETAADTATNAAKVAGDAKFEAARATEVAQTASSKAGQAIARVDHLEQKMVVEYHDDVNPSPIEMRKMRVGEKFNFVIGYTGVRLELPCVIEKKITTRSGDDVIVRVTDYIKGERETDTRSPTHGGKFKKLIYRAACDGRLSTKSQKRDIIELKPGQPRAA